MRGRAGENGVSVKAYAGTTGVLLGMNVEPSRREGLLGFALERLDGSSGEKEWPRSTFEWVEGASHERLMGRSL